MIVTHKLLDCNEMFVTHKFLDCNEMIVTHKLFDCNEMICTRTPPSWIFSNENGSFARFAKAFSFSFCTLLSHSGVCDQRREMTLLAVVWTTRALGDKFSRDYSYQVHSDL